MGWIEEERERRLQEEERILREKEKEKEMLLREREKLNQKWKHIEDFWGELLKANDNLPEDLRLVRTSDSIDGKTMKLTLQGNTIIVSESVRELYNFFFDTEKQRLIAKVKGHEALYELDRDSIDTIVKNLCTGQDIVSGLKLDSSIIAANIAAKKNAAVGLFVFIVFDLIICAINARSVDEFFLMVIFLPFVIFIIVKIVQFIRMVFS